MVTIMRDAVFHVEQKVFHKTKGKVGVVTRVFICPVIGIRYYIWHSGFTWSVPEASLSEAKNL